MQVIITGVAGFIGSNLARHLLEKGHKVTGIDNLSYGSLRNIQSLNAHTDFTFLEADLLDFKSLDKGKGEILVHLASFKIPRYTNALQTLTDNRSMLGNVVRKCNRDKIKLVFASTSDVYGKNKAYPYHENSDLVLGPTTVKRWAYALSKIYGEQYIIANHEQEGLSFTIMRFFGSYGPHQHLTWWGGPQSVFIGRALEKRPLEIHGDGLQTRTFTYVDDTVQGIMLCMFEAPAQNEIFNIANDPKEEISIKDLGTLIWQLIHGQNSKPAFEFIPYKTFGNYEDVRRRVPDIGKIIDKLGFDPQISLEEGLRRTIAWQKRIMAIT